MAEQQTTGTGADRRRHQRVALLQSAALREGARVIGCVIRDISMSGARILLEKRLPERQELALDIEGIGALSGRIVWQQEDQAGIQFLEEPGSVKSRFNAAWGEQTAWA